jgi:hypothetical protein
MMSSTTSQPMAAVSTTTSSSDEQILALTILHFPRKLFHLLNYTTESPLLNKIVAWNQAGTSFDVFNILKFEELVLCKFFRRKFYISLFFRISLLSNHNQLLSTRFQND